MGSTLYTERNSSIVDMRWVCLIFICAALVNFCSLASLNERLGPLTHGLRYKRAASDDEYVYEDVPVWVPPPGFVHPPSGIYALALTLFEGVPGVLSLMMTSADKVMYRKESFMGSEFITDQTLPLIFFKITLLPFSKLVK